MNILPEICVITTKFSENYHRFHKKYLQELTDDNGFSVMPTAHQYRQTDLRSLLDFQQKKYRTGESLSELTLDDFEEKGFK